MAMHNPPHPGEFIIQVYLDPNNLSGRELAGKLGVAASTLNRILTLEQKGSDPLSASRSARMSPFPCSILSSQPGPPLPDRWHGKQRRAVLSSISI